MNHEKNFDTVSKLTFDLSSFSGYPLNSFDNFFGKFRKVKSLDVCLSNNDNFNYLAQLLDNNYIDYLSLALSHDFSFEAHQKLGEII